MAPQKKTELTLTTKSQAGELSKVLAPLAKAGVNVLAYCGYNAGPNEAHIMLVPDDEAKATQALKAAGFDPKPNAVVVVTTDSGVGQGARLAEQLSKAGTNIEYSYASTSGTGVSTAVFKVPDVEKTIQNLG